MIDLLPSVEQQQIVDSVSSLLSDAAPVSRLRKKSGVRDEMSIWSSIANLGCFGLGMPEVLGGVGATVAEEMLVFREFGRFLLSPTFLSTAIAAHIAGLCGKQEIATRLIAGDAVAAFALPITDMNCGPSLEQGFALLDSDNADYCIIVSAGHASVYPVGDFAAICVRQPLDDAVTLKTASLVANNPVAFLDESEGQINRRILLLVTAMMVGIAEASRDMASNYAKVREQFGKPIGTFQAVKHSCADAAVHAEAALCQTIYATLRERDRRPDAIFQVNAAYLIASAAARRNTSANIQIHGGFGFTAECDAHFFLKRYNLLEHIVGPTRLRQMTLMDEMSPNYAD
jgi:alkylation response protein AidB-like acyl-CoA dehydrogenase